MELLFYNFSFFQVEPRLTQSWAQLLARREPPVRTSEEALQSFYWPSTPSHGRLLRAFTWPLCPPVLIHQLNKVHKYLAEHCMQWAVGWRGLWKSSVFPFAATAEEADLHCSHFSASPRKQ